MFNEIHNEICYHRQSFSDRVKGQGVQGQWKILLAAKQQPQQPQTGNKYLYTGVIDTFFQRLTIFMLHTGFWFFLRKIDLSHKFHFFIVLLLIHNSFFPQKQRKLLSQTNLDSKLNFLVDFGKNKKCKNGLKYFARIKF